MYVWTRTRISVPRNRFVNTSTTSPVPSPCQVRQEDHDRHCKQDKERDLPLVYWLNRKRYVLLKVVLGHHPCCCRCHRDCNGHLQVDVRLLQVILSLDNLPGHKVVRYRIARVLERNDFHFVQSNLDTMRVDVLSAQLPSQVASINNRKTISRTENIEVPDHLSTLRRKML